jgi:nucleotide-binding universal stress UspA family protein
MRQKILVAFDGSPKAYEAVDHAFRLATKIVGVSVLTFLGSLALGQAV